MGKFLKENWVFILLPVLLVTAVILYLVFASGGSGEFGGYDL